MHINTENDFYLLPVCEPCNKEYPTECPHHGLQHMHKKSPESKQSAIPRAMETCPDEVQLCVSSIPGAGYGLCAKQHIPVGTWIGPYEGTRIRPEDVNMGMDTSYLWEVSAFYVWSCSSVKKMEMMIVMLLIDDYDDEVADAVDDDDDGDDVDDEVDDAVDEIDDEVDGDDDDVDCVDCRIP